MTGKNARAFLRALAGAADHRPSIIRCLVAALAVFRGRKRDAFFYARVSFLSPASLAFLRANTDLRHVCS
jgi:hypothetical protein